jgi:N-dimethylarginine dimethylaminohydrolase
MVAPLRRVLVKRPGDAFASVDPERWHYTARPDLDGAMKEHDALVAILEEAGSEIVYQESPGLDSADAIYVHDPSIVCDGGAILLNMGKPLRADEPAAVGRTYEALGVPVLGRLTGEARAEGGDLLWIDHDTLAVGQGFRTNAEGLGRLEDLLRPFRVDLLPVPLPYFKGPDVCLHLMSLISLVDDDLAVIFAPLLPESFREEIERRGVRCVEVPDEELESMGPNVLAIAPRHCVMLEGNPVTRGRLEAAGCTVVTYRGNEISLKAEGGPTCLTRPVLRGYNGELSSPG